MQMIDGQSTETPIKGKQYEQEIKDCLPNNVACYLRFKYDANGDVENTYFADDTPPDIVKKYGGCLSPGNSVGNLFYIG